MLTLSSMLQRTTRLHGDKVAVRGVDASYTWSEFVDRVSRAAEALRGLGVEPGDCYGVIARNSFRQAEVICAGYWMGAIPVPINYRFAPPEIAYALDNAGCKLAIVDDDFAETFAGSELDSWSARVLILDAPQTSEHNRAYEQLLRQASPAQVHEPAEGDTALLLHTGGTTGRAKGVPLSHSNIISNALQLGFELSPRGDDIYLHAAAMFHSADLLAMPFFMTGASHVFLPKFSGRLALEAIQSHGVTVTLMTPSMLIMMMQEPGFENYDLSSLRQIIYGSAPMAAEWIRKMLERFRGVELIQAYGLTETSPILTLLSMNDHQRAVATNDNALLQSVGRQVPGVDLKIVDDDGHNLAANASGEIVVRGPNVAAGYLNRPDATAEAFRDGWFHTGDIGRLDARGYLCLLDRKKDLIITGGEIVYSSEVEAVLHQNRKVHECAVIGVPDETYGEALLAAVVAAPGEMIEGDELIAHCRGKIAGYKIPRRYIFLDELAKSAIDKVLKNELRRLYGNNK